MFLVNIVRLTGETRESIVFQVTEGEMYELVVTNYRGLYRYRTSDVIKIVGHYNQIPLYRFCYR